jgi:hypothetical protein
MYQEMDLKEIDERIKTIKFAANELKEMSYDFPAVNRNATRILASIKMLEINVSDIMDV